MKRIILSIILLIGSILMLPPVKSATLEEAQQLIKEVQNNCSIHHQVCIVRIIDANVIIANTNFNTINISTSTIKFFTKQELRSVMYHELAHAVLNHSERIDYYVADIRYRLDRDLTYDEYKKIHHQIENEADSYASSLLFLNNKINRLDTALIKLGNKYKKDFDEDFLTHPSTNKRLRNIRRYKILYGN